MSKLYAFFALLFLLIGCGHEQITISNNPKSVDIQPQMIPVYIDTNFSKEDKVSIQKSISEWNNSLNGQIIIQIQSFDFDMEPYKIEEILHNKGWMILQTSIKHGGIPDEEQYKQCMKEKQKDCYHTIAWADKLGGSTIKIVKERVNLDTLYYITLHEIGHLLGAEHVEDKRSLMYAHFTSDSYLCIDFQTVAQVAVFNQLNVSGLNYCIRE